MNRATLVVIAAVVLVVGLGLLLWPGGRGPAPPPPRPTPTAAEQYCNTLVALQRQLYPPGRVYDTAGELQELRTRCLIEQAAK
jgi:hypothetical protein